MTIHFWISICVHIKIIATSLGNYLIMSLIIRQVMFSHNWQEICSRNKVYTFSQFRTPVHSIVMRIQLKINDLLISVYSDQLLDCPATILYNSIEKRVNETIWINIITNKLFKIMSIFNMIWLITITDIWSNR